jgi:putative membrane protein
VSHPEPPPPTEVPVAQPLAQPLAQPPLQPLLQPHVNPYADPLVDHREWQRLDPLMLLVHPIREVLRFLPALLGVVVAGTASGGDQWWWNVLGIGAPVGLGIARYLTTSFRIAEGRVELRRGLLNKHVLSTPIDRVRAVDITASPIHRALGLTTVRIGTGTASRHGEDELALDGVRTYAAEALRSDLLHRSATPEARQQAAAPDNARVVARFEPRWLWYAPFTSSGLIIAAAVLGAGSQLLDAVGLWDHLALDVAADRVGHLSVVVLVPVLVVALLVVASVFAVLGYLVTNFGFAVTYTRSDHAWHVRRGLFTTRETSMDAHRLRGVALAEPLGLRLASGRRLTAIVTGLNRQQQGSSTLVPPAPELVARHVAAEVLGTSRPADAPLVAHGPAAVRRRYARALVVPVALLVALSAGVVFGDLPAGWLGLGGLAVLSGAGLAHDRSRGLGHALLPGHLVARSGSLTRRRVVLERHAVIGWTFSSTWFQRRVGLTTVVATMAGGRQAVTLLDVPETVGTTLARDAVPGLVAQFLEPLVPA